MHTKIPVNSWALNAKKNSKVQGCPIRFSSSTISTHVVTTHFLQCINWFLMLRVESMLLRASDRTIMMATKTALLNWWIFIDQLIKISWAAEWATFTQCSIMATTWRACKTLKFSNKKKKLWPLTKRTCKDKNTPSQTCSGDWELRREAMTPVIFSIQSIWSMALSACTNQKTQNKVNEQCIILTLM